MDNRNTNMQPMQNSSERYDAIRHISALIDTVRDAGSVPFTDKCSIGGT